jgi:membrane protease YdiL (CAAX protease family)
MRHPAKPPEIEAPSPRASSTPAAGAAAIIEVFVAFCLVHVAYRAIKHLTPIGQWERAAGTNFTPGLVMIGFTVGRVLLGRRSFKEYGLTLQHWRPDLSLGLACSLTMFSIGGLGLLASGYAYDPTRPPDPYQNPPWLKLAVVATFLAAGGLAALAMVADRSPRFRAVPPWASIPLIAGVLAALPAAASALHRPSMVPTVLWLFLGAGFGEEIFYRGYIQSHVEHACGRRCRWRGFEFGMGLVVSSLLFGVVHALNTVDYFHGRFDFGWRMGIQSVFHGLFFGLIRARTGSVLPGAIVHGLGDVLDQAATFIPR